VLRRRPRPSPGDTRPRTTRRRRPAESRAAARRGWARLRNSAASRRVYELATGTASRLLGAGTVLDVLNRTAVDALLERAHREVDEGLLPGCQVALAMNGEVEVFESYGDATPDTRYVVFSCTKPIVASAVWLLLAEGAVDLGE